VERTSQQKDQINSSAVSIASKKEHYSEVYLDITIFQKEKPK